uniref:Macaca fascicularis brain cDNA clone: QtrA-16692, similar to human O-linked mannose beta1,2-N-acetylglucosaminyltransferase(FLJ20277), mRNA, RefSeq: NM_017739.1 n=1 Tax=Macaca fascicularis TaxID=9541 RepID=I7GNN6_MACFA|nr:unnamed protein product [Macaca fascicularis]
MEVYAAARTPHPLSSALTRSQTTRSSMCLWLSLQGTDPITCTGCCALCFQPRGCLLR